MPSIVEQIAQLVLLASFIGTLLAVMAAKVIGMGVDAIVSAIQYVIQRRRWMRAARASAES